jgi:homoserine kinase
MKGPRPALRSPAPEGTPDAAGAVRVRVPATSANLGPAFDCAGLALTCHDVLEFSVTPSGLAVEISGMGEGELPTDESHLVVRAFRAACTELGWSPPGLRVVAANAIPQGRGMGSSAAAVVAGVLGAWSLCPDVEDIDGNAVLRLVSDLEGHPDNVAACLLGGFTLAWTDGGAARAIRMDPAKSIVPVVFVPAKPLLTETARGLLPDSVPHVDAAFNASRSALLVEAMTRRPELLLAATEDRLHQEYRAPAMTESVALMNRLRADGVPAVISGAGPTVMALPEGAEAAEKVALLAGAEWTANRLELDSSGASVLPLNAADGGRGVRSTYR